MIFEIFNNGLFSKASLMSLFSLRILLNKSQSENLIKIQFFLYFLLKINNFQFLIFLSIIDIFHYDFKISLCSLLFNLFESYQLNTPKTISKKTLRINHTLPYHIFLLYTGFCEKILIFFRLFFYFIKGNIRYILKPAINNC